MPLGAPVQKVDVTAYVDSRPSLPRRLGLAGATLLGLFGLLAFAGSGLAACPIAGLFHVPCPGCGATRSGWALLSLDLEGVLRWNPVALLAGVIMAALWGRAVMLLARDGHLRDLFRERIGGTLVLAYCAVWALGLVHWALRFFGFFGGPCPVG